MKNKLMAITALAGVLLAGYSFVTAQSAEDETAGMIGMVDMRQIFEQGRRTAEYQKQTMAQREQIVGNLEALDEEIEQLQGRNKTLRPGSEEQLQALREMMEKQAQLEALSQFHEQEIALKDQRWTENLYRQILSVTEEIADAKGLVLVLEKGRAELPAQSPNELMLTIRTHKVLYSGGCVDITDEVMERLDAEL